MMRFFRLAALLGSLVLLVATSISIVHRRGDIRSDQSASVEQAVTLASTSVRSSVERARGDVNLVASVAARGDGSDDLALALDLASLTADAEACVGNSAAGCTGSDLLASATVGELAAASTRAGDDADTSIRALVAVDTATDSIYVVRRVAVAGEVTTVALRIPVANLVGAAMRAEFDSGGTELDVSAQRRGTDDERSAVTTDGGVRVIDETIASPFVDGSIIVESSVDGSVGLFGDRAANYLLLLGLGTVLLALAGWTFLVERRHLERRATTDELTGLINRREFERVTEEALDAADRFNTGLCLMVVDLNGFKQVNDTLGHQFGDRVLKASSDRLVAAVRDTDVVGRWGGDEFVILLPGLADRGAVRKSAERIWDSLGGTPVVGDTVMTGSIGAAIFPRHGVTLDALMRAADVAMYEAKTTGVSHRIADTIAVSESLLGDDGAADTPIITDHYVGPDRRHAIDDSIDVTPAGGAVVPSDFAPPTSARADDHSTIS